MTRKFVYLAAFAMVVAPLMTAQVSAQAPQGAPAAASACPPAHGWYRQAKTAPATPSRPIAPQRQPARAPTTFTRAEEPLIRRPDPQVG